MRYFLLFVLMLISEVTCAQLEWQPLDQGLAFSFSHRIEKLQFDSVNNRLLVSGLYYYDGQGNEMGGLNYFSFSDETWHQIGSKWPSSADSFGYFQEELYSSGTLSFESIGADESLHFFNDGDWQIELQGPLGTVFESIEVDGLLYLVGGFEEVDGQSTASIALYDGESYEPFFGSYDGSNLWIEDIIEYNDDIYVAGQNITGWPNYEFRGIAKLGDESLEVAHEDFTGLFFQLWPHCLEVFQDKLYVGGYLNSDQGFADNGLVAFDGNDMYSVGGGVNREVLDMEVYQGELYVAGRFNRIGPDVEWEVSAVGVPCYGLAKWDGFDWTCLNSDPESWVSFNTIDIYHDTIFVGGTFSQLAGDTAMSMVAYASLASISGIEDLGLPTFSLYPNPSQGELNLDFGQLLNSDAEVEIYNAIGQRLLNVALIAGQQTYLLETPYAAGLYYLQLQLGGERVSKKFMVRD